MNEIQEVSDTYILRARETRYCGYSDLTTEQALAWCLPKHPHPLNQIHNGCRWCEVERQCFEAGHPATQARNSLWWNALISLVSEERLTCLQSEKGFTFSFVRINHPDGRWWVAIVVDTVNSANFDGLTVEALGKMKG